MRRFQQRPVPAHQPSGSDQILVFAALDLYWTTPESRATVVQINGREKRRSGRSLGAGRGARGRGSFCVLASPRACKRPGALKRDTRVTCEVAGSSCEIARPRGQGESISPALDHIPRA